MSDDVTALLEEIRDELRALRAQTASGARGLLSVRAAALELGIDRAILSREISAGRVRVVPYGAGERIPRAEVDRLSREGIAPPPRVGRPRRPRRSVEEEILNLPLPRR